MRAVHCRALSGVCGLLAGEGDVASRVDLGELMSGGKDGAIIVGE